MIHREAAGADRHIEMTAGELMRSFPDIRIEADNNAARFKLTGGLGFVPITFTGLTANSEFQLTIDGQPLDQSVHGNDFWQTDYDPTTKTWSRTYNIPAAGSDSALIALAPHR